MKKWLKSIVCGTHEQYMRALFTGEKSKSYSKKKKKKDNLKRKRGEAQNALSKRTLNTRYAI